MALEVHLIPAMQYCGLEGIFLGIVQGGATEDEAASVDLSSADLSSVTADPIDLAGVVDHTTDLARAVDPTTDVDPNHCVFSPTDGPLSLLHPPGETTSTEAPSVFSQAVDYLFPKTDHFTDHDAAAVSGAVSGAASPGLVLQRELAVVAGQTMLEATTKTLGRGVVAGIGMSLGLEALERWTGRDLTVAEYAGSILSGASTGATLGSIIPVVGTVGGMVVGGMFGAASQYVGSHITDWYTRWKPY